MRLLAIGGRGFVGGHLLQRCAEMGIEADSYDLIDGQDARDLVGLVLAMRGCDTVVHLASNADIAKAQKSPMVDFDCGTAITAIVVEAARLCGVKTIVYFSGSGIYGDQGSKSLSESDGGLVTSPYAASKIAGEALVSAYCHMFSMRGIALRPANIVGPGQTHGVGYDFINKLRNDPTKLEILGDGAQSKSYISVDDVIDAVFVVLSHFEQPYVAYNVATTDHLSVREIAKMTCEILGVQPHLKFGDTPGGWNGDVPVVRLDSTRLRNLGWHPRHSSQEAMEIALKAMT